MQFFSSRPWEIARLNCQVGVRLLSGFVRRWSVLRGARVHIGIHASEAVPSADMHGTRVLVTVVMTMAATRRFSWSRSVPRSRSYLPAGFRGRVASEGRVQSISELLTADSSDRLMLVASSRRVTSVASTMTTATLSCSFIILDSVLRGLVAASVMMVVVRWWRVLLGGLAWAVSWARRALRWGTWWPTPVVHLTGVGWLVVPHKLSTWDSWLLGMHGARWSTHHPKANKLIWI